MLITTIPWHITGLMGQPRRVAIFDYSDPFVARMAPLVIISVIGGSILLVSAILLIVVLVRSHFGERTLAEPLRYALAVNPPQHGPGIPQRLRALERDPAGADGRRLRLPDRPVLLPEDRRVPAYEVTTPSARAGGAVMARDRRGHSSSTIRGRGSAGLSAAGLLVGRPSSSASSSSAAISRTTPTLELWGAICRGLGITADTGPAARTAAAAAHADADRLDPRHARRRLPPAMPSMARSSP